MSTKETTGSLFENPTQKPPPVPVVFDLPGMSIVSVMRRADYRLGRPGRLAQSVLENVVKELQQAGAEPQVVNAVFEVGERWIEDPRKMTKLVSSWKRVCLKAGIIWGGGETQTLKDILDPDQISVHAHCWGIKL